MSSGERADRDDLDPTGRFSDRAEDYRRYRPDYPAAALDAILAGLGDATRLRAADIGAGTGISSRQLAARGVRVLAVEPNAGMRAAASPHKRVEWREGTAEATGLASGSVGLVLCAQAFHWFRAPLALAEFHRILGPGGRLALMWNSRDREDPLTQGYVEAIHAVNGEHPVEQIPFEPTAIAAAGLFTAPREARYPHAQMLDREGLIGRATSASYVPRDGEPLARLQTMLAILWERERDARGMVAMRYVTKVFLAERRQALRARARRLRAGERSTSIVAEEAHMVFKHAGSVPEEPVASGTGTTRQVLIGPNEGPHFAMRRFIMKPGGGIPRHSNTVEHEQYVLRGRARVGVGDDVLTVKEGDVLFIPAGTPHWYEVQGQEPFEFICVVPNQPDRIEMLPR